jgi:hypothetical protein
MTRHLAAKGGLAATGVLASVLLTACGGLSGTPSAAGSSTGSTTTTTTTPNGSAVPSQSTTGPAPRTGAPGASTAAPAASAGAPGTPARTGECRSADLKVTVGGSDGAAGHIFQQLVFTNAGSTTCVIVGFPGVSYVTGDNGAQVGAPAVRDGAIGPQVTLRPGQVASATVAETNIGVFDPAVCKPTPTRGFRVYPPDETHSVFVATNGMGCAGNPPDPQLRVRTIVPGPGAP